MTPQRQRQPRILAWLVLSLGMTGTLLVVGRGHGFSLCAWAGLAALCLLLAGVLVHMTWWER